MHIGKINQCFYRTLCSLKLSQLDQAFFITLDNEMNFIIYFVAYCLSFLFEYQV